jgi:rod shape-determining protein MreD
VISAVKVTALVFVASILEVSVFADVKILGGVPDLLLVTVVAVALLRGSVTGACAGFFAGLVVDTATLETLGLSSLLLTLIGYWVGRYGETTGRDRTHAPFLSVAVVTFLYALGGLALRFVLGEPAPARVVLLDSLFQGIALNLLLTVPVYAVVRRLLPPRFRVTRGEGAPALG